MVLGIQIFGILFGLAMAYFSFLLFKRKEYTTKEFVVWLGVWIGLIIVALFPNILDFFVVKFHFSRPLDLLIVVGSMFLLTVTFKTYNIVRKNQNKIEDIVRKVALEKKEE